MPVKKEIKTVHLYGHTKAERTDRRLVVYAKVELPQRVPKDQAFDEAVKLVPDFHAISQVTNRQFTKHDGGVRGLWTKRVKITHHHNAG
jgi:hypothetical protein